MPDKDTYKPGPAVTGSTILAADKYRLIVENTPLMVSTVVLTPEPVITYASPSHQQALGYESEDLIGTPVLSLVHPQDMPLLRQVLEEQLVALGPAALNGQLDGLKADVEARLRHADGSFRLLEIVGRGLGREIMLASQDITEQREALHVIIDSEERFRLIFENAPEAYYIIDGDGKFVDGNQAAEALVGDSRELFIGKSFFKVGLIHPKHLPRAAALLARNLMGRRGGPDEFLIRRKDGVWLTVEVTTFPVRHKDKRWVLGIARDITDRKKNEESIRKAMLRAEEASRAKSSFLAGMSHELRTPLNAIIGFSEILLDKQVGELNETQEEYLNDIHQSGKHLLNLINEVLDLAKVEAGRMELARGAVNIGAVCNNSLVMVREKTLKHGIRLECSVGKMPEYLALDERKVKQVLFNLLSNAVKFTPDRGRVTLRASLADAADGNTEAGQGALGESAPPDGVPGLWVLVEVEDSGIGVDPAQMESLFEPFEQVEGAAVDGSVGTGLGLALSRRLVELHGGSLIGRSDGLRKGSCFTATFPTWECREEETGG